MKRIHILWVTLPLLLFVVLSTVFDPRSAAQLEAAGTPPQVLSVTFPKVILPDGKPVTGSLTFSDEDHDAVRVELSVVRAFDFEGLSVPIVLALQTPGSTMFSLSTTVLQPVALEARVVDARGLVSEPLLFHFAAVTPDREVTPDVYFINAWGEQGRGPGQFNFEGPQGIRVSGDGEVYVIDEGAHRIQVFTPQGEYLREWGSLGRSGRGVFHFPSDLVFDDQGRIYVSDSLNHRIQVFDLEFNYLFEWGKLGFAEGDFNAPRGLAINSRGELIVADEFNRRIQVFSLDGHFLRQWGRSGKEAPGEFNVIVGVAVDADDNVYVADGFNHRIQVFDAEGNFLRMWGEYGDGPGQFDDPVGVAVAPEGWVAVTDNSPIRTLGVVNDRVHIWTTDGQFLRVWGSQGDESGTGFKLPLGAATDGMGMLYIGDHFNRRAQSFYIALGPEEIAAEVAKIEAGEGE